jgi:hypothetical protein
VFRLRAGEFEVPAVLLEIKKRALVLNVGERLVDILSRITGKAKCVAYQS